MKRSNSLKISNLILSWFPPVIWMIVIFYFSSRPRFGISHQFVFDFIIFKTLHLIEYGILYFLLFRAFYKTTNLPPSKKFLYSFLFALFYAITDEFHQLFVPTREGKIRDIIIDTIGIGLVCYYIKTKIQVLKETL